MPPLWTTLNVFIVKYLLCSVICWSVLLFPWEVSGYVVLRWDRRILHLRFNKENISTFSNMGDNQVSLVKKEQVIPPCSTSYYYEIIFTTVLQRNCMSLLGDQHGGVDGAGIMRVEFETWSVWPECADEGMRELQRLKQWKTLHTQTELLSHCHSQAIERYCGWEQWKQKWWKKFWIRIVNVLHERNLPYSRRWSFPYRTYCHRTKRWHER